MKTVALGLALAAGFLAMALFLRGGESLREPTPAKVAKASVQVNRRHDPEVVLAIVPGVASAGAVAQQPAAARPARSALLAEFAAARDFKPIYERLAAAAARTPEEDWLLARIAELCNRRVALRTNEVREGLEDALEQAKEVFEASLPPKDPHRARRVAAFERLTADRCAGLPAVKVAPHRIRALYQAAADRGDPKAQVELALLDIRAAQSNPYRPRGPGGNVPVANAARLEVLKAALESGDPQAVIRGAEALVDPAGAIGLRAGARELPVDQAAFRNAAALLACDLGYPCGPEHETLLRACALAGQCEARDLREFFLFYASTPHQSQLMAEYHAALARVVQARDWSHFVFHRGAPFAPR